MKFISAHAQWSLRAVPGAEASVRRSFFKVKSKRLHKNRSYTQECESQ